MTKLEIDFKCNLPLNVSREHRLEAERRATRIFVLALLEMGSLNIAKAAELLGIDRHAVVQMAIDRGIYTREIDSMRLSIDPEAIAYTLKEEPKMLKTGLGLDREAIAYTNHQANMFEEMRSDLLEEYEGKWVFFEDGKVLDADCDRQALLSRVDRKRRNQPVFVTKQLPQKGQMNAGALVL